MLLFGFLVYRLGTRSGMVLATGSFIGLSIVMAFNQPLWAQDFVLSAFIYVAHCLLLVIIVVWALAAMRMCTPAVAATQFALYMVLPNLGASIGAAMLGPVERLGGYQGIFIGIAVSLTLGGIIFFLFCGPKDSPAK